MTLNVVYGVIAALSLLLAIGYGVLVRRKNTWLMLLFVSVFAVNIGYFSLSMSSTLEEALLANRISYLGSVFLPLCMLMAIAEVCRVNYGRWAVGMLLIVSILVFLLAASPGYSNLYYQDVTLEVVDGVSTLNKVYGPLHDVYLFYLLGYFGTMIATVLRSVLKRRTVTHKHAALLLTIVLLNIGIWFVERLIDSDFEFLSISYIISELLLLMLYAMLQEFGLLPGEGAMASAIEATAVEVSDTVEIAAPVEETASAEEESRGAGFPPDRAQQIMAAWPAAALLSAREGDVLYLLLQDRRRKDIAAELKVTEHTVKKHTANIFAKTGVTNRAELFEKAERETR